MIHHFDLAIAAPCGPVVVGGYTPSVEGSVSSQSEVGGKLMLPATAVRGALRETLERLLRGMGRAACVRGTGLEPGAAEGASFTACRIDDDRECLACRLFGSANTADRGGANEGLLTVGDAVAAAPFRTTLRASVAIARSTRSAASDHLHAVSAAHASGLVYHAPATLRRPHDADDAEWKALLDALDAAARGTTHMGRGRSRGLGRVNLELSAGGAEPASELQLPEGDLEIALRVASPTHVGTALPGHAFLDTRLELPGSAVRGMLGWSIARSLKDPDGHDEFQRLVRGDGQGATFDFFYPVDGIVGTVWRGTTPRPWPTTMRVCRRHPRAAVDTLFDRLALRRGESVDAWRCPHCDRPLGRPRFGGPRAQREPDTRVVTRSAQDRRIGSVRDGALFAHRLIEPGALFVGSIRGVGAGSRALLEDALRGPLSIGKGRSRGWGRLEVVGVRSRVDEAPLADRAASYRQRAPFADDPRLITVTFLSPGLYHQDETDEALLAELGQVDVVLGARSFTEERGWCRHPSGRKTVRHTVRAVAAGAVYVVRLAQPPALNTLAAIERRGLIGPMLLAQEAGPQTSLALDRRCQGFGRVRFFDPIHLEYTK